jgi:hypothetical protein
VRFKGTEQKRKRFQITLEEWEKELSLTYRELRSLEHGLQLMGPEVRDQAFRCNKNYAAVRVVEFGSTKKDCHVVAKRIAELVEHFDINEIVLWDCLSKDFDLYEYRIREDSFRELESEFGPWDIDWFASDWSKRLDRFASRYWTVGSEITDVFSQKWAEDEGFFHPPVSGLFLVMEKVEKYGARGVIVMPDWPRSEADSIMRQAGEMVMLKGVMEVIFESPEWRKDNTYRGMPSLGMRVYEIKG